MHGIVKEGKESHYFAIGTTVVSVLTGAHHCLVEQKRHSAGTCVYEKPRCIAVDTVCGFRQSSEVLEHTLGVL